MAYNSPVWSGFSVAGQVAAGEGTTAGRRGSIAANFASGPVFVGVVYDKLEEMSLNFSKPPTSIPIVDANTLQAALTYDLKVVKLFAKYASTELERPGTTIQLDTIALGALVPIGKGRLMLEGARTEKEQTAVTDATRTTVSFGYGYDLSKRTDLYAVAISDKLTNVKRGTGYTVGVRHNL